ncbi:MAG: SurA N-terminal domain-containing protein [Coriobacteriia bacterium]|nr:SurA N-terminal domain-containing protein [Coriobacteriia bacterium]
MGTMSKTVARMATAGVALALGLGCLAGCQGKADERQAGRALDHVVTEQDVMDYLDDFRKGSATADDDAWAAWMGKMGTTPEKLRAEVVRYLAENWLVERAAEQAGVGVTDEEVDQKVQEQKDLYTSDLAWQRALINSGYTEDYYRLSVKSDLLREKIKGTFVSPTQVTDEELESFANSQMSSRITRRTSAVFVEAERDSNKRMSAKAKAADARKELLDGADFAQVFAKYSSTKHSEDGNMGYDLVSVPNVAYREAMAGLREVGDVSDVVEADDGYYVIVVTDVFEVPEGNRYKLSQFPQELLDAWRAQMGTTGTSDEYDAFMRENVSEVQIAVEPMPDGLPYDVEPVAAAGAGVGAAESEEQGEKPADEGSK